MNVLWGYLASYGYLFAIILFCGFLQRRRVLSGELSRKAIHILIAFTWCLMDVFWGRSYHQIIISATFVIINFLSYKFKFLSGVERAGKSHAGTVYYALAMLALSVASFLYEPLYLPFGAAVFALSFGDGFAPIFGGIKKGNKKLVGEKSLYGAIACFSFSAAAIAAFSAVYSLGLTAEEILGLGALSSVVELFSLNGLDNFSLSFIVAVGVLSCVAKTFSSAFWICVSLSIWVVLAALYFKALTPAAAFVAETFMVVAAYVTDWTAFLVYVAPFFIIAIAGILKKKDKKTSKGRGVKQVLINGLPALAGFIVYKATGHTSFFVLGGAALCACFSDSCASDYGYFSKRTPYDPIRRKKVERGVSGGITLLGSLAAVLGAAILAALSAVGQPLSFAPLFIFVGGVSGCSLDTIIGSLFQALYAYPIPLEPALDGDVAQAVRYLYLETPSYYQIPAFVKGVKAINNDAVNLLSGVGSALFVFIVYVLIFQL